MGLTNGERLLMKEPQIFTSTQAQGVAVPQDILKNLEQGSMDSITERWRKFEKGETKD